MTEYNVNRQLCDMEMEDGTFVVVRYLRNQYNPERTIDIQVAWHGEEQNPLEEDPEKEVSFYIVVGSDRSVELVP